ncbi:hypothetical protein B0A48_14008 [Cryoendolithus antarcticus]|uniref:SAC domain-containing protein n=1 Tax=Cryoendolithus antarcticus TaxID=1507870 RepID=A0A1V8SMP2_9PEZI|nr:hypothetical protein B0A48_14008 [Cryoendolithus antarcticus]
MEEGPVDAYPSSASEYEPPSTSPERRRTRLTAVSDAQVERDTVTDSNGDPERSVDDDGESDDVTVKSNASGDSELSQDRPLYPRVGDPSDDEDGRQYNADHSEDHGPAAEQGDGASGAPTRPFRMHKFTLYETNARYWIAGADIRDTQFKLLRIDRTSPPGRLAVTEDEAVYDRQQMNDNLAAIDRGNKATGGLRLKYVFWGLLGFIRFTESYYMLLITKRQQVAIIGGHYVYQVEATDLVPLTTGSSSSFMRNRNAEEARFLSIFNNLDLSKSFYFSYSYNITRTLQQNIILQREALLEGRHPGTPDYNNVFVWNHHLLGPARRVLDHAYDWCMPIVHGFIDQAALDVFGRSIYITIVGRRSRFFAGARFLKRGINDLGYVANDVETEQIVSEMLTSSFHAPGPRLYSNPTWTSFVHHRGSIPLYWSQDNSGVTPKPDIDLNLQDPFYEPAALHFDHLFMRYGCPIYVLNLIKSRERTPRESKLLDAFKHCIEFLNQSLPEGKKIIYKAFDMSRASKTRGGDVIGNLETIADDIVAKVGFFHNGDADLDEPHVQNGVARTNCVDCLDRTNAAQFVIGKQAFGRQLHALGVLGSSHVDYDTDAVNIFTHMFHDHGDTIAVQYGGSHLVNTMATYRKLNHWQAHSQNMVESFKRYYHNSFLDNQRQEAYNLFLGNYVWISGQPMLWDLTTDYYLHHSDPRSWLRRERRDYYQWFTPEYLGPRQLPPAVQGRPETTGHEIVDYDDYWLEFYRPTTLSSFLKLYTYRMNNTQRYLPDRPARDHKTFDFSPFKPRLEPHRQNSIDSPEKKPLRKGVTIVDPTDPPPNTPLDAQTPRPHIKFNDEPSSILRERMHRHSVPVVAATLDPADKAQMHLWSLNQFHTNSLNPSVTASETAEYSRYITHPLTLPLVTTSTDIPSDTNLDYLSYLSRADDALDPEDFGVSDHDMREFEAFLAEREEVLTVLEEDGGKKRYKAYKQWLRGKSLFKQSKVDPEYLSGV